MTCSNETIDTFLSFINMSNGNKSSLQRAIRTLTVSSEHDVDVPVLIDSAIKSWFNIFHVSRRSMQLFDNRFR